ncbi:DUF4383 domain-containing protein [Streptantibioticus silvisoli]|uniref:DUF4383 domain-containing protein n=1 Tax=Streptantibioticus silvisoli TaxID=2705255 RepID=A0ABT6VST5_9ACTN|nr:DUF4383 domain-containing protein [Streptantibioticus silvisoli]MDI5961528.1 DUF4383 domain-containing protein [Streptantibioticus silvisoli]
MLRLDEHLPTDHPLSRVYRAGAGLMGLVLLTFGILGFFGQVGFFSTNGDQVAGLSSNGALSLLSVVVGPLLLGGMIIGGNVASTVNMVLGVVFVLSGFVNLALLDTGANFLAFKISNVLFSFVFGLILMTFGMYGRVHSHLPHDNPYWQQRHPEQAERERLAQDDGTGRQPEAVTAHGRPLRPPPGAPPGGSRPLSPSDGRGSDRPRR